MVATMKKMGWCVAVSAAVMSMASCASYRTTDLLVESAYGFVAEVDEPSTRGVLTRITPPDMYVRWKFAVSPDGGSVVFSARRAGSSDPYQLYRMDMGSAAPIKITSGGDRDAWDPSYTSDGEHIVYRTGTTFWKVRKDGSGAKQKIPGSGLNRDYYPTVSSQDRIAFVVYESLTNTYTIWTSGVDGSDLTQYREGNVPTWSPDGSKIAFEYDGDIWMMGADGRELVQLTSTGDVLEGVPSFSPDGMKIAFVSDENPFGEPEGNVNVWYMNVDGTGKTQVTELESWDSWPQWGKDGLYFLSGRAKGDKKVLRIWRVKN